VHMSVLLVIIVIKITNMRQKRTKINQNLKTSLYSIRYYWEYIFPIIGIIIACLSTINLVLFEREQSETDLGIHNEKLSWCFWLSVAGTGAVILSVAIALWNLTVSSKHENDENDTVYKYNMRTFIDAYKKPNNPFYGLNEENKPHGTPPNSAFASYVIEQIDTTNGNISQNQMKLTSSGVLITTSRTAINNEANMSNGLIPSSPEDENDGNKSAPFDPQISQHASSTASLNQNYQNAVQVSQATTNMPSNSAFIYSQIYPITSK